ncbi:MAG: signal recognition particle-docking protein FtsY [Spirochaetales bacterium]|nr:signal recognition particle-docking protein FtsY [Spirochaetales bacterium]MDD6841938.1 signal recognition particle-docking protein FtsY [Spirochaetales bacterium]
MGLFSKFSAKIKQLFSSRKIDEAFFEELEDTLIEGDLGARLTDEIIETLRKEAKAKNLVEAADLQKLMKELLSQYIHAYDVELKDGLNVFMILGVNGVGKTTSIAKMAKWYTKKGEKVLLAAADTFRAAAVDQLDIHAERLGMRIVKQKMGSDPGAVVYDAVTSAIAQGDDLVLADTAGRMHNKENLMRELQKMDKIVKGRGVKEENYKKFIVIDATTGQNGLSQAMLFNQAVKLDGVILTKYDSAAKGGALVQIGKNLGIPIAFVGTGEGYDDIHPFDKEEYLDALIGLDR